MELDSFLFPKDSPYNDNRTTINSFDFNSDYDRNTVTTQKIRDFSFNNGQGGTLTLGGLNNGNGILRVLDSGGTPRVVFGNTGGTITNGNLIIINDTGGTTLDNKGVVSTTLLTSGAASVGAGYNQPISDPTGTAFIPFTNGTLNFTLSRSIGVLFLAQAIFYNPTGTANADLIMIQRLNGTEVERAVEEITFGNESDTFTTFSHYYSLLNAGTYSYVVAATNSNSGTELVYKYRMTYIQIGT